MEIWTPYGRAGVYFTSLIIQVTAAVLNTNLIIKTRKLIERKIDRIIFLASCVQFCQAVTTFSKTTYVYINSSEFVLLSICGMYKSIIFITIIHTYR